MVVTLQIVFQTYMVNYGMQESATALIGNQIGAMNVVLAKRYSAIIACETLCVALLVSTLLFSVRVQLIGMFTNDEALASICLSVCPFYFFVGNLIDALMVSLQGIVRALGIQRLAFFITAANLYLVSVPFAYVLGFVAQLQVKGLWYGQYCGVFTLTVSLLLALWRTEWEHCA